MTIFKFICALGLVVQIQGYSTSGSNSSPSLGDSRSEGLNTLFGKNFQIGLQSQSLAFTPGNEPQRYANDKAVTDSDENDELRHLSLDLLETTKDGHKADNLGGEEDEEEDETSYTGSSQKRNKLNEAISNGQESTTASSVAISKNGAHVEKTNAKMEFDDSPRARLIMLLKARAIAKSTKKKGSKKILNQEENGDHEVHDDITKMTLHNIVSQTEESEKKLRKMQKRASVQEDVETENVAASGSADNPLKDTEASGKPADQSTNSLSALKGVRREQQSETKGEPEFSGKNLGVIGEQGSGDVQDSGSGMALLKTFQEQVTIVEGDSNKVVSGRRDPKQRPTLKRNVRLGAHFNPTRGIVKGEGGEESISEKMPFDPVLLFQVRNIRTNVLKAEKQATQELNDVRKEFRAKMEDLEEDLRMVKKLTSNVHKKVGLTVQQALTMAREAKTNATKRLYMARKATTALNNIEKKLGVIHTKNASRILRSRIPQFPKLSDVALYRQLLATDSILTKLDGAKALAVTRAEKRFRNEEETGSSIEEEVDSLKDELTSAEKELSEETDAEMEDEREAQEKIQEAMERNKLVAKKTAFALTAIENYLEKLQTDESKLKRLRF